MHKLSGILLFLAVCGTASAQLSTSAYRVLGQTDLRQNGLNMVTGTSLNQPYGAALDTRGGQTHVYISDSRNNRVLAWPDLSSYQAGDAPALVLGQPGPTYSNSLGIGAKGLALPAGLAVNPLNGDLYVADFGDNRVVRFPAPFSNPSRIEPDAVFGQPNFTTVTAAAASATSLNAPRAVAFDSSGNLWVSDSGNHRILRFAASVLNSQTTPAADTVIGQKDFYSNLANQGGTVSNAGLNTPSGLAFDSQGNLYVADYLNTRVLRFAVPAPPGGNTTASAVWGETDFVTRGVPSQASASTLAGPNGVAVDSGGRLYVAVATDNRVLIFPKGSASGGAADTVLGQTDFLTTKPDAGVYPLASPNTLAGPSDVEVDQNGNVLVVDGGNNRVLEFSSGAKAASKVWGQSDFSSNGANQIKPASINFPYKMAIDYSSTPFALYVSDTANNRVLIWKDSAHFHSGDPADLVIGQPNLRTGAANVDTQGSLNPSATSLSGPEGIAVNQTDGTLYVADSGNHRVLRFPRPVSQAGRITPDAVLGQVDFTSSASAAVTAATLHSPSGVAIGPQGAVFVADSGNNRVLEFLAGAGTGSTAIRVFGQPGMLTGLKPTQVSAQTVLSPQGIAVDSASNLYVADTGSNRVLIFPGTDSAPVAGAAATFVLGQNGFTGTAAGSTSHSLSSPTDVAVDSLGTIYVADYGNNRVQEFSSLVFLAVSGASATGVVGQQSTSGSAPNYDTPDGLATAEGLYAPVGIYIDRQGTLYVGDAGNNRVLHFLKPAATVNAASYQASAAVAQGSLASLFGNQLAAGQSTVSATTWPISLLNRQLLVNDSLAAPIYYMGTGQVNFQVPMNAPLGTDRIAVVTADTGELVAGGTLLVSSAAPGIFTSNQSGSGQGAVLNQDNSINSSSNPAPAGSTVVLYGTGQGQVSPAVPDGTAAPLTPLSNTVAVPTSSGSTCLNSQPSMCVAVGSTGFGDVKYSGLAPGYIGLWQINVVIPAGTPSGAVPVRVLINGAPSNVVTVAVK
jgi:uncharacterized protein (TIGR03437 family)